MIREYRHRRRVQFYETDLAGVVHFSWYLRYMEEAEHAMWRDAGISIVSEEAEFGFPRIAATVEYNAPLHFEDEFEIHVRLDAITRRSIRYSFTLTRETTTIATGTIAAVCVSKVPPPMHAVEIPQRIVDALSART